MIRFYDFSTDQKIRMAYNNDVFKFEGSDGTALYADVSLPGVTVRLYPSPSGTFFINLKPYVSALINTHNFEDRLQPNPEAQNPETYVYPSSEGTILKANVTFTVTYTDAGTDVGIFSLLWLAGAQQLESRNLLNKFHLHVLSPVTKSSANKYHLNYWQGYPFDVSVYLKSGTLFLYNQTNLLQQEFFISDTEDYKVVRLVLSNGDEDETLEDIFPLQTGTITL